jgi:translation initiation factor IF-1
LLALLSPRVMFSFLLGLGTAGVALRSVTGGPLLLAIAVAGGVAFERLLVNPLWNFMFRFASSPAQTLESTIEDAAKAVTNFDQNGQGLIAVEVDGHLVQVLGTLNQADRSAGVRVRAGDVVRIEEVDADRNRCTVRKS